jgi:hypothetical protein
MAARGASRASQAAGGARGDQVCRRAPSAQLNRHLNERAACQLRCPRGYARDTISILRSRSRARGECGDCEFAFPRKTLCSSAPAAHYFDADMRGERRDGRRVSCTTRVARPGLRGWEFCPICPFFANFSTFTKIPQVPSFQAHSPVKTVFRQNPKNARKSQNTPSTNPHQNETQFPLSSLRDQSERRI